MTFSLPTVFMQTMETALQSALVAGGFRQPVSQIVPTGVRMDRSEPVGTNETSNNGPVLCIYCDTIASTDTECHNELQLVLPFHVDIHMYYSPEQRFREVVDPVVQRVHTTIMTAGAAVPGVRIISLRVIALMEEANGASIMKMVYSVQQYAHQIDLTASA